MGKSPLALSLLALLLPAPAVAGVPEAVAAAEIPAYRLLRPDLAVAGQPSPETLARLKDMGFRTVVNLRTEKEGAAAEGPVVEAQGLRYVWIPVTPDTFSEADVEAVGKVLADPSAFPVLVHCASSNRVGGVWTVLESRRGKSLDEALAAGRAAGLHSPQMEAAVRRVLGVPEPEPAAPPAVKP
ncbi:MAG TPA: protein tyrosine phosphatase family protein [Vicinamibacteria bacterium]